MFACLGIFPKTIAPLYLSAALLGAPPQIVRMLRAAPQSSPILKIVETTTVLAIKETIIYQEPIAPELRWRIERTLDVVLPILGKYPPRNLIAERTMAPATADLTRNKDVTIVLTTSDNPKVHQAFGGLTPSSDTFTMSFVDSATSRNAIMVYILWDRVLDAPPAIGISRAVVALCEALYGTVQDWWVLPPGQSFDQNAAEARAARRTIEVLETLILTWNMPDQGRDLIAALSDRLDEQQQKLAELSAK